MGELREVGLAQPEKKEACQEYYELWLRNPLAILPQLVGAKVTFVREPLSRGITPFIMLAALPWLLLYEGIGHLPYLETPDRFFREVDEFLRQRKK